MRVAALASPLPNDFVVTEDGVRLEALGSTDCLTTHRRIRILPRNAIRLNATIAIFFSCSFPRDSYYAPSWDCAGSSASQWVREVELAEAHSLVAHPVFFSQHPGFFSAVRALRAGEEPSYAPSIRHRVSHVPADPQHFRPIRHDGRRGRPSRPSLDRFTPTPPHQKGGNPRAESVTPSERRDDCATGGASDRSRHRSVAAGLR